MIVHSANRAACNDAHAVCSVCVSVCVCVVWLQDGYEMFPQCPVLVDSECGPCLPTLFVNYLRVIGMLAVVANL